MEKTALDRVFGYVAAREARPLRGSDDCIHALHLGEEFEGLLNYSDLKAVLALLHDANMRNGLLTDALEDIIEACSPPGVPNVQYVLTTAQKALSANK